MTTPHAAAAAAARQRLASVLGTLQQDPNVPPSVLEILSGLARAMGPLFQLERGSADTQLFVTARGVLQETLEKIQGADAKYPGVAEATEAIAQCLGIIFKAMKEAGLVPAPGGAAVAPQASAPAQAQPIVQPVPLQPAQQIHPLVAPAQAHAPQPAPSQPAMQARPAPQPAPPAQAIPLGQPKNAPHASPAAAPVASAKPAGPPQKPSTAMSAASVPIGPNGLPRLESEIGVHSETNFFTDFLGDIKNGGGIFVATFHVLGVGTPCEVILTFPGNLTAEIRGAVRWKRENAPGMSSASSPGLGIEITQADAAAWDLIHRFIRKREPIMHEM